MKKHYYLILYTESEDNSPFDYIPHLRHSLTFANMRGDILLFSILFNRYGFISTKHINKFLSQAEIATYVCKNMDEFNDLVTAHILKTDTDAFISIYSKRPDSYDIELLLYTDIETIPLMHNAIKTNKINSGSLV